MSDPEICGDRPAVDLGRDICVDLAAAEQREWLATNGIGGYASGTVAGLPTRAYHGLLVAALDPPVGRTVKLVTVIESVAVAGETVELGTVRWHDGTVAPSGYRYLERFWLDGRVPVWRFATGRFVLEKRIHMDQGANVNPHRLRQFVVARAPGAQPARHHRPSRLSRAHVRRGRRTGAARRRPYASIPAGGTADLHVRLENGRAEASGTWYRGFDLPQERARGLTDSEDHVFAGTVSATLAPGNTVQLVANCAARPAAIDHGAHAAGRAREQSLLGAWHAAHGADAAPAPDWVRQLVLAADQFIVGRATSPRQRRAHA